LALQRFRLGWVVGLVFQSTYNRPTTSVTGSETEVKAQTEGTEGKNGWWFGTFFIFPYIRNFIIPTEELIFFHQPDDFVVDFPCPF